ncbi:hypothetical protein ABWH89_11185 [Hoeflea alexandrii]|uniref:hypothetical protein n=1 Tax=Hoeflea alexandrii TaxID=288436 RepID=UPI0035CE9A71
MELSLTPIRSQEPLIIERLRLAFPEKTFALERIPQVLSVNEFKRLSKSSPFIGLAWTGMRPDPASGRMLKGVMQWRLVLIYKASSGLEARFKGDTKGIGLDAMIDVAMVLLQGVSFEGQGHTAVTLANSVIADGWSDDDIAIAQIDFTFSFANTPAPLGLMTVDDFKALGITWEVAPDDPDASKVALSLTDELTPQQET